MNLAPGSHRPPRDRWATLAELAPHLPTGALYVVDEVLERHHPALTRAIAKSKPRAVVRLEGGEKAKTLSSLERVLVEGVSLPRSGTLVAIGGGTVGDLGTVAAHVLKRGVELIQIPSTVLAAVDSSLGGKGALDLEAGGRLLKNVMGTFHYASQTWLCPELFTSLTPEQRREGAIEAWKMVLCLDSAVFRQWTRRPPSLETLVRTGRRLKANVCRKDPYEQRGIREVLNFGHTFGHVLESLSNFTLTHGDAVGLGMRCALDVGMLAGVTSPTVAAILDEALTEKAGVLPRSELTRLLEGRRAEELSAILKADKKAGPNGELRMVLVAFPGRWKLRAVPASLWRGLLPRWKRGLAA